MSITEILIQETFSNWNDCNELSGKRVLQLSLLRQLIRKLHSEKSRYLARGLRKEAQDLKEWELKIQNLRERPSLNEDLATLLQSSAPLNKAKQQRLPEALFQRIDSEKLNRYDREWEKAIASEAIHLGWNFWSFTLWVKVDLIEEWEKKLSSVLWPHGVILFAENYGQKTSFHVDELNSTTLWQGQWTLVMDSRFQHPSEILSSLTSVQELPENPPAAPKWARLYP